MQLPLPLPPLGAAAFGAGAGAFAPLDTWAKIIGTGVPKKVPFRVR